MEEITLEKRNEAQKLVTRDTEVLRLVGESDSIGISGSVRGDGRWRSDLPAEDYEAVKEFLVKRVNARIKQNKKIVG